MYQYIGLPFTTLSIIKTSSMISHTHTGDTPEHGHRINIAYAITIVLASYLFRVAMFWGIAHILIGQPQVTSPATVWGASESQILSCHLLSNRYSVSVQLNMCRGKHTNSLSLYPLTPHCHYCKVSMMSCMKKYLKIRSLLHLVMLTICLEKTAMNAFFFTSSVHLTILGRPYKLLYSLSIVAARTPMYGQIRIHNWMRI